DGLALKLAVECVARKASPRTALPALASRVLLAAGVSASARARVLLGGVELKRAGIEPGQEMGRLLDELAREQWAGRVARRAAALKWLKIHVASTSGKR